MQEERILNERYKLLERIGVGGMASVYRAEDMLLGRHVAIKMLHEGLLGDETFVRQFQHEAHAAANLTHPNIVTVHDIGQDGHHSYIVMEYVAGQTVKQIAREFVDRDQFMPLNRILDLSIQICNGLGYAHRAGLVHCDVKPQNVLVTIDERVKVTDFGIARAMSQVTGQRSDMVWGTPNYFSPEQAAGETPTPASDVYAIGIILFELLTNELPFTAESPTAVALKHIQEPPPPVQSLNPAIPREIAQIVQKVLAKEPAGRYRTAGQLGRILRTFQQKTESPTTAVQPVSKQEPIAILLPPPSSTPKREIPLADRTTRPLTNDFGQPLVETSPDTSEEDTTPTSPSASIGLIVLGIIALLTILGLIPLWYSVAVAWGAL